MLCHRNLRRSGFTLVELLVVIGIIALLISILLPTLARVRKQGQSAVCLSNVRQITQAMVMYCIDNKSFTMTNIYQGGNEMYWWQALQKYWGVKRQITVGIGTNDDDPEVRKAMKVIQCPSADVVPATAIGGFGNYSGTAVTAWRHKSGGYGSYCLNMWLTPYGVYGPLGDPYTTGTGGSPPPNTPIAIADPATYGDLTTEKFFWKFSQAKPNTPIVGDGWWIGTWPRNTDFGTSGAITPTPNLVYGGPDTKGFFINRYLINRHYGAINMGLADGSARRVPLNELFTFYWHKGSVPRDGTYRINAPTK